MNSMNPRRMLKQPNPLVGAVQLVVHGLPELYAAAVEVDCRGPHCLESVDSMPPTVEVLAACGEYVLPRRSLLYNLGRYWDQTNATGMVEDSWR